MKLLLEILSLFETMSSIKDIQNPAIDNLILTSRKEWIPCSPITNIESSQVDIVYYATRKQYLMMVVKPMKLRARYYYLEDDIITPWLHTYCRMVRTEYR